ncbi:Homogentisate 1,2-dioxygenase [Naviculisporaceae sp. PSN 640]
MSIMERTKIATDKLDDSTVLEPDVDFDPYKYQCGFGNHHSTEAIPGALPAHGSNLPQKCPYGLVAEHISGTSFIASRETASNVWLYRERPAVAHDPAKPVQEAHQIRASFLPTNQDVSFPPTGHAWGPLTTAPYKQPAWPGLFGTAPLDGEAVDTTFIQGLKTIGGHGDPTLKDSKGLAVHQYAFNEDMDQEAFANHDGEFLLVPQHGTLDIKTELGMLRVKPGMIGVIPAGIRFSIAIVRPGRRIVGAAARLLFRVQEEARGYVLEVFGDHFRLPDLGVLGANGLAHVRDFEYPVAAFDFHSPSASPSTLNWRITVKLAGRLSRYNQSHSPFDVIAWHGKYAPYRYNLANFAHMTANRDQLDPTAFTVLTVPSGKKSGESLIDFCVFGEKWAVVKDSLRIPYHHRTSATEIVGVIKGTYTGSVRPIEAGGLKFEQIFTPHGETYEAWKKDREDAHRPGVVCKGFLGFMFHISAPMGLTKWATEEHPDIRLDPRGLWSSMRSHLMDHIDEINANLKKVGRPSLYSGTAPGDRPSTDKKKKGSGMNLPTPPETSDWTMLASDVREALEKVQK